MTILSGARLVLADRMLDGGSLTLDAGHIVAIADRPIDGEPSVDCRGLTIVPGFVDAHIHGVDGVDTLDGPDAIARIAAVLPRRGVTAFCPTTVACAPDALRHVLQQVRAARIAPSPESARVIGAHLESNFINPDFRGAQPAGCIRTWISAGQGAHQASSGDAYFVTADLRDVIDAFAPDIATVTLAPEMDGGLALIDWLVQRRIRVSLGHSGADDAMTLEAVARGARQVTHLFNAMPPMHHRRPGLAGVALQCPELVVELICDGVHVHPTMVKVAVAAKGAPRVLAVSDATAAAGLPAGASARLGDNPIVAGDRCAHLADGTIAGSTTTLDAAFTRLTRDMGIPLVDAAQLCSTAPARELGLRDCGRLAEGAAADLAVLDAGGRIVSTYIAGRLVYTAPGTSGNSRQSASV
ncbi:MAG: N-acetylglucosamine-6-phosphate deacetylase [Vicinamibacterales bacterium]